MTKQVRFTKEVKKFILTKMAQGNDIATITRKWPDKVPHPDSIYRKSLEDKDFGEEIDRAYTILLMHRMDELHRLAGLTATEAFPHVEDWRQAEATLKRKMDEAKFVLGKMSPILSRRFDRTQKVEVSGIDSAPQLAVINYYNEPAPAVKLDRVLDKCTVIDAKPSE